MLGLISESSVARSSGFTLAISDQLSEALNTFLLTVCLTCTSNLVPRSLMWNGLSPTAHGAVLMSLDYAVP